MLSVATFILLFAWTFSEPFLRHIFSITYSTVIPNQVYITEKHVTYIINTKPHTCIDTARQITLVRYEEGFNSTFGLNVSFLAVNSCNLSCYIKTGVWFCICIDLFVLATPGSLALSCKSLSICICRTCMILSNIKKLNIL